MLSRAWNSGSVSGARWEAGTADPAWTPTRLDTVTSPSGEQTKSAYQLDRAPPAGYRVRLPAAGIQAYQPRPGDQETQPLLLLALEGRGGGYFENDSRTVIAVGSGNDWFLQEGIESRDETIDRCNAENNPWV